MEKKTKALMILTMVLATFLQTIEGGREVPTSNEEIYNPQHLWGIGGFGLGGPGGLGLGGPGGFGLGVPGGMGVGGGGGILGLGLNLVAPFLRALIGPSVGGSGPGSSTGKGTSLALLGSELPNAMLKDAKNNAGVADSPKGSDDAAKTKSP